MQASMEHVDDKGWRAFDRRCIIGNEDGMYVLFYWVFVQFSCIP